MPKYILDPNGDVKKFDEETKEYVSESSIDSFAKKEIFESFMKKVAVDGETGIYKTDSDFDLDSTSEANNPSFTINRKSNTNFNFINDPTGNKEKTKEFRSFNTIEDIETKSIFASEFEMLGGTRNSFSGAGESLEFLLFSIDYLLETISLISTAEIFVLLNSIAQDDEGVEENYHLKIGHYNLVKYDVFTEYIFDIINYPKDKLNFGERIASYFLGFAEFIAPDKVIKVDEILNDTTGYKNTLDFLTDDVKNNSTRNKNLTGSLTIVFVAIANYLIELLLTLNASQTKRMTLLMRKFGFERIWNNNLHGEDKAKQRVDNDFDNFFRIMDFYFFRFAVERMHIGKRILRYHIYNATPLPHRLRESPNNRYGIGKSDYKADIQIDYKNGSSWKLTDSGNEFSQGIRIRALPQLLNLNANYVHNLLANSDSENDDPLPLDKSLMQNFYFNKKNRIPDEIAREIENHLESEYMPFYFRDLRTNEIISFHAFLDNINDSFSADYAPTTGFGRVDEVKAYTKTTRSISLGFTVASTSQEDHDLMWYQINKLISMCYPQWSGGVDTEFNNKIKGKYPFSQVITASPLIRLRVGDIIKSNYSKTSLSRIHGLEDSQDILNSFAEETEFYGSDTLKKVKVILPGMYRHSPSGFGALFSGPSYIHIKKPTIVEEIVKGGLGIPEIKRKSKNVKITDNNSAYKDKELVVDKRSIITKDTYNTSDNTFIDNVDEVMNSTKPNNESPINNPITKSFESGMGRGLAGFITQLDLQYADSTWEVSRIGSKAPIFLKINISFSPIHDIQPGIDHRGMMRAPTHNTGRMVNEMYGDPYDTKFIGSGRKEALGKNKENEDKSIE